MTQKDDRTPELWGSFMPVRNRVSHRTGTHFYSMQVYPKNTQVSPDTLFEKWAVVEVTEFVELPEGMTSYEIEGGHYAVFEHHGPASTFPRTMAAIFQGWLPSSGYVIDDREHFEVLEEGYSPTDLQAFEEIWIPIRRQG